MCCKSFIYSVFISLLSLAVLPGCQTEAETALTESNPLPSYINPDPIAVGEQPPFDTMVEVKEKKKAFFEYLAPIVDDENTYLMALRTQMLELQEKVVASEVLSAQETDWLQGLASQYKINDCDLISSSKCWVLLNRRVDVIPTPLVLAQAANESGWGTSRFAIEGNNYFGQWCFSAGCGLVPSDRDNDANHEVRVFESVNESVRSYLHNLNTFHTYQVLRSMREELRANGEPLSSVILARGLEKYSERGAEYVAEIIELIHYNDLTRFNNELRQVADNAPAV